MRVKSGLYFYTRERSIMKNTADRSFAIAVRLGLVLIVVILATLYFTSSTAAQKEPPTKSGSKDLPEGSAKGKEGGRIREVCTYPRYAPKAPFASRRLQLAISATETEPNNTVASAQALALGFAAGQDMDVDITGRLPGEDVDVFSFQGAKGDIFGAACLSLEINSKITLIDPQGTPVLANDNHGGLASLYPPASPLPAGGGANDSALAYNLPAAGRYCIKVEKGPSFPNPSGEYLLQLRIRKPNLERQARDTRQIIYLDFDGANVNALTLFGEGGNETARLAPMSDFLGAWGLAAMDRDPLIDAIVAGISGHFDAVRMSSNNPGFGIEIRNSKDHPALAALA